MTWRPFCQWAYSLSLMLALNAPTVAQEWEVFGKACQTTDCDQLSCDSMPCEGAARDWSQCFTCDGYDQFKLDLAECGIALTSNLTQFSFGTVDGGLRQTGRYGGHGDYVARLDLGKLGLHEGLLLQLRAEHRFGESINQETGAILPATLAADLPVSESREILLSNVLFTQFLTPTFAVYAGKLDTLDGDQNAYASGRGISQFNNVALVANPIALRTIPYASLGFGFVVLREGEPLLNFLVMNPTDTVESDGFDELFREGVALSAEVRFSTRFGSRPGHQLFAGTWSSRDFVSFDQDPRIILPTVPINRTSGAWSLYWNMDQALWVQRGNPERHWGFFARAGIADDQTNPISFLLSGGLGGASPLRQRDTFGIGYYFSGTSNEVGPILETVLGPIEDGQGLEWFYRMQLTNGWSITPDLQWILPARQNVTDAFVMGLRANFQF
ncbi:MAG: carbohydrate porin [Planctomycetota bacterium]